MPLEEILSNSIRQKQARETKGAEDPVTEAVPSRGDPSFAAAALIFSSSVWLGRISWQS